MKWIGPLFFLILFTACEGFIKLSGKVVSDDSREKIVGARVQLLDLPPIQHLDSLTNKFKDSIFVTDNSGRFIVRSRLVPMLFGVPNYRIKISKEGYKELELKVDSKVLKEIRRTTDTLLVINLKRII